MSARPTAAVHEDVTRTIAAIKGLLAALPSEDDAPTPKERERLWHIRRTLNGTANTLISPFEGRLRKLDPRLAERQNWFQQLTACRLDLEKALAQVEGSNFRLEEELRQSLRIIRDGAEDHEEVFAGPVIRWLVTRGIRPEPGARSFFAGRGGLLSTERDIAELEQERNDIVERLEASLKAAEQFIGGLAAPVATV